MATRRGVSLGVVERRSATVDVGRPPVGEVVLGGGAHQLRISTINA
jgi:hypothetical protein